MRIIIKNLDGTELLNSEFVSVSVNDKLFSFNFKSTSLIDVNLDTDKIYNVSFENSTEVGLVDTMIMSYSSYYYNAATALTTNEQGDKVPIIVANSNTITLKKY